MDSQDRQRSGAAPLRRVVEEVEPDSFDFIAYVHLEGQAAGEGVERAGGVDDELLEQVGM